MTGLLRQMYSQKHAGACWLQVETVYLGDRKISIRTSALEEKATACNMLCCYADELKDGFLPYVEQVSQEPPAVCQYPARANQIPEFMCSMHAWHAHTYGGWHVLVLATKEAMSLAGTGVCLSSSNLHLPMGCSLTCVVPFDHAVSVQQRYEIVQLRLPWWTGSLRSCKNIMWQR